MRNSILANNIATAGDPDCYATINTSDHNIIGNTFGCTVTAGTGDKFNVGPKISPIPIGAIGYYALLSGSPAIDVAASLAALLRMNEAAAPARQRMRYRCI